MRQATNKKTQDAAELQAIKEQAFRAGYGMGGDAYQHEHRHRAFLTEEEALAKWRESQSC